MSAETLRIPADFYSPEFDNRTKGWEVVQIWFLSGALVVYIAVCHFLKQYMTPREPYNVKAVMILYNIFLTALSAYMFHELIAVCWWYYASKFFEFFDTWFMLVRKKFNQVSFLHLYHHSSIAFMTWYAVVFVPGGHTFFAPLLNCFVHTVMYFYYLLAALGVSQRFLWWKKYITSLQLTQFVLILAHSILGLFHNCGFPRHYLLLLFFYNVSMFVLFRDFYSKAYTRKPAASVSTNSKKPVKAE